MKAFSILSMLPVAVVTTQAEAYSQPYNYRTSSAYHNLAESDRTKLDTISRDMTLLWDALDRYADDHDNRAPESLDDLVPLYLKALPKDPFATKESATTERNGYYQSSLEGYGYGYRQGQGRSWITSSVGLPNFPYLAERGNVGLYLPKGMWISGRQPTARER
jgi:hypothetical protein